MIIILIYKDEKLRLFKKINSCLRQVALCYNYLAEYLK